MGQTSTKAPPPPPPSLVIVPPRFEPRRPARLRAWPYLFQEEITKDSRSLLRNLFAVNQPIKAELFVLQEDLECYFHVYRDLRSKHGLDGGAFFAFQPAENVAIEGGLFAEGKGKGPGGGLLTVAHTLPKYNISSVLQVGHLRKWKSKALALLDEDNEISSAGGHKADRSTNSTGNNLFFDNMELGSGVMYSHKKFDCGFYASLPLTGNLTSVSLRGSQNLISDTLTGLGCSGDAWLMVRAKDKLNVGVFAHSSGGAMDSIEGVACYRSNGDFRTFLRGPNVTFANQSDTQTTDEDLSGNDVASGDNNVNDEPAFTVSLQVAKDLRPQVLNKDVSLSLAYYQRFVTRRKVKNPFEEKYVNFITNYLDFGAELAVSGRGTNISFGCGWQINKNNLIKARVDHDSVSLLYAFKSWWEPAVTVGLTGSSRLASPGEVRLGVSLQVENWGAVRYDRPKATYRRSVPVLLEPDTNNQETSSNPRTISTTRKLN